MKLSQKLTQKIKMNFAIVLLIIAVIISTLVAYKLAYISMPFNKMSQVQTSENIVNATKTTSTEVTIADDGAIICESIVEGVRDCDLVDGNYTFRVTGTIDGVEETKDYAVEFINYYDDVTYSLADGETSKTVSLGDSTTEYKMLVVKYHGDLTIDSGVTVTATNVSNLTYKKGMYLCVMGEIKNKGTISMTARGTYNCAGENVYLWKNTDGSFEYVPAVGADGGDAKSITRSVCADSYTTSATMTGNKGDDGSNRQTGGGGTGGVQSWRSTNAGTTTAAKGGKGTSYSGGSGSGGGTQL